jgi:hypothetical protein
MAYGKKSNMKKSKPKSKGLTAKQKTLPPALQKAILNKKKKK